MLVRITLILAVFCGFLKSHDGVHGDFLLSKAAEERYADLLVDPENQELIKILLDPSVHSHTNFSQEMREKLSVFREKIRGRSDLIADILQKERVSFNGKISSEDYDSISRSVMVLNFIIHREMSEPKEIVEEVRARLESWKYFGDNKSKNHGYLNALFGTLISYGDSGDLETLEKFREHPDGIIKFGADNAYSRLKKRLDEQQGRKKSDRVSTDRIARISDQREAQKKSSMSEEAKPEERGNLPLIIAGVLLVGILALLFKVIKGKSTP